MITVTYTYPYVSHVEQYPSKDDALRLIVDAKNLAMRLGAKFPELVAGRELVALLTGSPLVPKQARGRIPGMTAFGMPVVENQYKGMAFEVTEGAL
jgi:hypothetical protein